MKKRKILIADDDRHIRMALRVRLQSWGFRVVESTDGLGVIDLAVREGVDAMVLDHEMPNGDGRTVARMIRKECDAPIIFLSGHEKEAFRDIVTSTPDVYFLPKPLDQVQLRALLEELLGAARTGTEAEVAC